MKTLKNLVLIVALVAFTSSCDKSENRSSLVVKMTDAPGDFLEVNVEILNVEIHYESDSESEWVQLKTNSGIYDLLKLQNDVSVVIADQNSLPVGRLEQMRLILGNHNTVVTPTGIHELELSSQDKTGLKININRKMNPHQKMEILLDFDAEESIVLTGSDTYKLKPVIKLKSLNYLK